MARTRSTGKRAHARPARKGRAGGGTGALRELAARMGIIDEYVDQTGKETRRTSDRTRVALLAAMGIDATNDAQARRSLDELDAEEERGVVPPASVIAVDDRGAGMRVRVGAGVRAIEWSYSITDEHGHVRTDDGRAPAANGVATVAYPAELPAGYYDVRLQLRADGVAREGRQRLVVTPGRCPSPVEVLKGRKVFGLTANLYTLHGRESWGIGTLGDLRTLVEWGAEVGAAFIGLNPLHALFNRGADISPYSPVSRLFRNHLYLDISSIPELAESREAKEMIDAPDVRAMRADLRLSDQVEYERIARTLDPILRALHASFVERHSGGTDRAEQFRAYVESQGEALEDYATFMALAAMARGGRGEQTSPSWRDWPKRYRDPRSASVREFREANADEIDFHRWLQFELDRQMAAAATTARAGGMPIGLYQDLAIGTSPNGSDVWAFPDLFLSGAAIGAPPDPLATTGQNWGLPPIDPRRLAQDGYRYWIDLVRASLRHSGALRIDHVMGLFRQFWIPEGMTGKDGAYVRFPSAELLGILALEATRAGALVVGEDLGTVPPDVPPALEARNILSSKVLYFERTKNGGFKPASSYAELALATPNTHDMPTIAGWWNGRDIKLRNDAGQLGKPGRGDDDPAVAKAHDERDAEKSALLRRLASEGLLPAAKEPESNTELRAAVHSFLCRSPAALVGMSIDDIVGEKNPVNMPGVAPDSFPSWTRRLRIPVETLRADTTIHTALGERRGQP